jgi:hypothetical protein
VKPFNPIIAPERALDVLGVPGRYVGATMRHDEQPGCFCRQRWISERRRFRAYDPAGWLQVEVRFDDGCRNGHNSFAITATASHPGARDIDAGGCLHDDIVKVFPKLAPLIKWHFMAADGPMHYASNTVYHAGDRDCHGLAAGESRQLRNGKSNLPAWELVAVGPDGEVVPTYKLPKYADAVNAPACAFTLKWRPWCRIGEGKPRDLDAARHYAIWPEATDDELIAPGLRERLESRLPALVANFKETIEAAGFIWERQS